MAATATPIALVLGVTQDIELSAVAGTLSRLDPPANARYLKIVPRTSDCKLVRGGTDAAAIGATAYETLYADTLAKIDVPGTSGGRTRNTDSAVAASNGRRVCLASAVASVIVEVTAL